MPFVPSLARTTLNSLFSVIFFVPIVTFTDPLTCSFLVYLSRYSSPSAQLFLTHSVFLTVCAPRLLLHILADCYDISSTDIPCVSMRAHRVGDTPCFGARFVECAYFNTYAVRTCLFHMRTSLSLRMFGC